MAMQEEFLEKRGVQITDDPKEDYDVVHLNTIFLSDYLMAKKQNIKVRKSFIMHIPRKKIFAILLSDRILSLHSLKCGSRNVIRREI